MISIERVERIASAVDEITDEYGLNRGEALLAFTSMLLTTLEDCSSDVRDVLQEAVAESLRTKSCVPLHQCLAVRKPS